MLVIVGVGNPGQQYVKNRHNIGFWIVEAICQYYAFEPFRVKDHGWVSEGKINSQKVIALKPMTYMNRSGQAVGEISRFYKVSSEHIIVIHDDIELKFGQIRLKQGGGHGGHNGLKDIDAHIGREYWRLRFGVGHPGHREKVTSYVLGDFSKSEEQAITPLLEKISHEFYRIVEGDLSGFLNKLSPILSKHKPKAPIEEKNNGV